MRIMSYFQDVFQLTLMAGMQTVIGYRTTYQPAQKKATGKATITSTISQMINHSGLAILATREKQSASHKYVIRTVD